MTYTIQLLIYSAATNTGMHTIQQARLLYPSIYIIAVASAQHHSRLQNLGADACFDYKSSTIEKDVKALQKDVTRALDCFSEGSSTALCATLMGKAGAKGHTGRIVRTLPPGMIKGTVPSGIRADEWILSYTALGKVCPSFLLTIFFFLCIIIFSSKLFFAQIPLSSDEIPLLF